jgi:glutaconate CoA-transferase subunit B
MPQNSRTFVETIDFVTTLGHGRTGRERRALGIPTRGPVLIVTDLCTMRPDAETNEFQVASLHPGVTRDQVRSNTGWPIRFADAVGETPPPAATELEILRDLHARTTRAGKVARA